MFRPGTGVDVPHAKADCRWLCFRLGGGGGGDGFDGV